MLIVNIKKKKEKRKKKGRVKDGNAQHHIRRPDGCSKSCVDYHDCEEVEKMNVGRNIRQIRKEKGFTQAYVAEKAGISQAMLCQIERGTKNPSLQVGKEIADILGCTMESLLEDQIV